MKQQRSGDYFSHERRFRARFTILHGASVVGALMLIVPLTFATALSPPPPPIERVSSMQLTLQCEHPFLFSSLLISSLAPSVQADTTTEAMTSVVELPMSTTTYATKLDLKSIQKLENDVVVRVVDQNTVKLKRNGLISFAAIQTPSGFKNNFQFPACMSKSPSSKVRQLLPAGKRVSVRFTDSDKSSSGRPRAALVVTNDETLLVNSELVRTGFAKPTSRGRDGCEQILPGFTQQLLFFQKEAQDNAVGMFINCDLQQQETMIATDDQFEPLEYTVQTKWGDDGGKQVLQQQKIGATERPLNPGDTKGCSDFDYYEDALRWYETFEPWYGNVAKLDPDHDGVPCPGLAHTRDQTKYRMKVPSSR